MPSDCPQQPPRQQQSQPYPSQQFAPQMPGRGLSSGSANVDSAGIVSGLTRVMLSSIQCGTRVRSLSGTKERREIWNNQSYYSLPSALSFFLCLMFLCVYSVTSFSTDVLFSVLNFWVGCMATDILTLKFTHHQSNCLSLPLPPAPPPPHLSAPPPLDLIILGSGPGQCHGGKYVVLVWFVGGNALPQGPPYWPPQSQPSPPVTQLPPTGELGRRFPAIIALCLFSPQCVFPPFFRLRPQGTAISDTIVFPSAWFFPLCLLAIKA